MWHHCNLLDHSKPGVCVTETISSVPLIFPFFKIIKQWSFIEYHGYIWQVSWKVSCGDPWNIRPSAVIARSYITSYYLHHWVIETDYGSESGGRFKNTYELLNLRALKFSPVNKIRIFQCMGMIFCVEFQRYPLKLHTKYLTHTLKDVTFKQHWNFKSS